MDVAQAPGRETGLMPTERDVAQASGDGDGKAAGIRNRDRVVDRKPVFNQKRDRQRAAADAQHSGQRTNRPAGCRV
jgi:hypothetical protein